MPRRIDELFYDITARTTGFTKGLARAQSDGKRFLKTLGGPAGLTAGLVAFGAAAVAAGIKATKMAASLDSALREVSTLLPGTVENVSRLREQIVQLSTEVPETPELLSRGLYQVISAGITDAAEAMEVLRVAAKAATAGLTDTFTSVDAITTVLNAYGFSADEAARVSDVFFQTVKAGKLTFSDLSANIGTVATSAALAGVSIEEVAAALATMTKFGINTARAATSLDALFRSVTSATDEQRESAKALGVEYTVAGLRAKGLAGFLTELESKTGGSVEKLAQLTTQAEAQRAAFVLAGQGAAEFRSILEDTNAAAGATGDAFGKVNGSLENQAALLKNKINAAWLNLGNSILPVVLEALEQVNRLLESDAETIARLYERVGLAQEALELRLAQSQDRIARGLGKSQANLEIALQRFGLLREQFERGGGGPSSGGAPGLFAALGDLVSQSGRETLFPDLASTTSLEQARDLVDSALAFGTGLERSLGLTREQQKALAEVLNKQSAIRGQIEAQLAGEQALADVATNLGRARGDITPAPGADEPAEGIRRARDEVEVLLDGLRDVDRVLQEAGDAGADLFSAVPGVFAEARKQFEELGKSLDADFDQLNLEARLLHAQRAIEAINRSSATFQQKALAIQSVFEAWGVTVDQLPRSFRESLGELLQIQTSTEEVTDDTRELIQNISFAARSAVELAGAFGVVGEEISAVVNGVSLIGEGIGRIATGDVLGGIGGAVSGIAGIISSISTPSPETLAAIAAQERNTDRLETLNNRLDVLTDVLRDLPGDLASGFVSAFESVEFSGGNVIEGRDDLREFLERLTEQGLTVADIERLAEKSNIDAEILVDTLRKLAAGEDIAPGSVDFAIDELEKLFGAIDRSVANLGATVAGKLELLQREFDRFDIDNPLDQLRILADAIDEFGVNLTADEIERLAAGDEDLIEELLRQATSGTGRFTELEDFDKLTQDQFIDLLDQIESIADRVGEDAAAGKEGDFQQVSAQNRFTVEQGNRSIALDGTRNFYLEQIRDLLRDGELVALVRQAPLPHVQPIKMTDSLLHAAQQTVRVEHHVSVDVVGGEGLNPESAGALGRELAASLGSVDRSLGAELRRVRAGFGLPPTDTQ